MSHRHPVIPILLNEEFDRLFDSETQPVFGDMPSTVTLAAQFERPVQFRLWKHRIAKRYFRWVHRHCKAPDQDRFFISRELFNALDERPERQWLEKPQKRRK